MAHDIGTARSPSKGCGQRWAHTLIVRAGGRAGPEARGIVSVVACLFMFCRERSSLQRTSPKRQCSPVPEERTGHVFRVRKSTRAISALTGNSPSPNGGEVRNRSCEIWEEGPHIPSYKVKVGRQAS